MGSSINPLMAQSGPHCVDAMVRLLATYPEGGLSATGPKSVSPQCASCRSLRETVAVFQKPVTQPTGEDGKFAPPPPDFGAGHSECRDPDPFWTLELPGRSTVGSYSYPLMNASSSALT